jgi:SnoaL-like polyketide cyclase
MSQENVDVVRASIEAWNSGEMDAFGELHDPEVIVRSVEGWPEPGPYVGREGFIRQFKQQREAFEGDNGADVRLHDPQGKDLLPGVLLGPRGKPSKELACRISPRQTEGLEVGAAGFEPATSRV